MSGTQAQGDESLTSGPLLSRGRGDEGWVSRCQASGAQGPVPDQQLLISKGAHMCSLFFSRCALFHS